MSGDQIKTAIIQQSNSIQFTLGKYEAVLLKGASFLKWSVQHIKNLFYPP